MIRAARLQVGGQEPLRTGVAFKLGSAGEVLGLSPNLPLHFLD